MRILKILLILIIFSNNIKSQFVLNGSATHNGNGEYILTPSQGARVGSIWNLNKVSLNESFELNFELNFGTRSNGADGITFCLQPLTTSIGVPGGGMGVGGVDPSIFVEFDTFRNGGEPNFDHLAIQRNGDNRHTGVNNLSTPVRISNNEVSVKNGNWYPVRIVWNATTNLFQVFVNCDLRAQYNGDIVNQIFSGDPNVFWGFTAATGGAFNEHKVRNVRSDLIKINDETICKGNNVKINVPPTNSLFNWIPNTNIQNPNSLNPIFSPTETTTYIIRYDGLCNTFIDDTITINVLPDREVKPASIPTICLNTPITNIIHETKGVDNIISTIGLPNGLSAKYESNKIIISGTPTQEGEFNYTITPNGCGSDVATGTIIIESLKIDNTTPETFCIGQNVDIKHKTNLTTNIINWTGLPNGLIPISDNNNIIIRGNPVQEGNFNYKINVSSSCGNKELNGSLEVNKCKVDTFYVCKGESVLIKKENVELGEWDGSEFFEKISEGSINAKPSKTTKYYLTSYTKVKNELINGDFEEPVLNAFSLKNANLVPGWNTTATDNLIEFWNNGFLGTPAYSGNQFIELNANMPSSLYQDMNTNPGDKLTWGFAHRGRSGDETIHFEIGPPGGPYVRIQTVTTGKEWKYYSGIYDVPIGQTTTRFHYTSGMPGAAGNLIDAVEFFVLKEKIDSFVVVVKELPIVNLGNDTTICKGSNLVLDVKNVGSNYKWNTNESTQKIIVDKSGLYSVEVRDNIGCLKTDEIKITVKDLPIVNLGNDTTICKGSNVVLDAKNVSSNYKWNTNESVQKITVTETGLYSVEVKDNIGCLGSDEIKITVKDLPIVSLGNDTTICKGSNVVLDAKNVGSNYNWNTNESTQKITVDKSGLYSVEVRDNIGCLGSDEIKITVKDLPVVNLGNDTTICKGELIILDAKNIGLNYKWSTNESTQKIIVDKSGLYSVEVRDNIGCLGSDEVKITVKELPIVNLGNDTTICKGDKIIIDAKNVGSNYNWNTNESTQKITVDKSGLYSVEVRDNIGCLGSDEIKITVKDLPVVNLGNDTTICKGESIILDAKNIGLNYKWNNSKTTQKITVTESGLYSVEVRDNIGCLGVDEIKITVKELPVINLGNDTTICKKESIILDTKNIGLNYKWNTNESTQKITVTETGLYSVEVRDNIGCLGVDEIKITVKELPIVNLGNDTIICNFDFIELDAKNVGSNYKWNDGQTNQTIIVNLTGLYSVEVRDNIGCLGSDEIKITVKDLPVVNLGNDTTICKGSNVILDAKNVGSNYKWNNSKTTQKITVTESGLYSVEVRDNIGCLKTDEIKITVKELPIVNLGNDTTICKGSNVILDAKNVGSNYKWNNSKTTQKITVTESGLYSVEVRDNIGCLKTDEIKIIVKDLPIVNLGNDTTICKGDNIIIDAKNVGSNYKWNNSKTTQKITVTESGFYSVEVRDNIGCLKTDEIKITVKELPIVNLGNDTTICKGDNITIDAKNIGLNYKWSTNESTQKITVDKSGLYSVEVRDNIGCLGSDEIKITVKELPIVNLGNDTTICKKESIILDAKNIGLNYKWSTNETTQKIIIDKSGLYSVEVRDNIGCLGVDDILIVKEEIEDPYSEKEKYFCLGDSILLEPDFYNEYTINWKNNSGSKITVYETGDYISYVSTKNCIDTFSIRVNKVDTPIVSIIDLGGKQSYCFNIETTDLRVSTNQNNLVFDWDDFGRTDMVRIESPKTYYLTAYNNYCNSRFKIEIKEYCEGQIFIPNAFSPYVKNGINDNFKVISNNYLNDFELLIFNRWGDIIFKTNDINEYWDGTVNGDLVKTDVYVYKVKYSYDSKYDGTIKKEQVGTITIY